MHCICRNKFKTMKLPFVITALYLLFAGCAPSGQPESGSTSYDAKGKEAKIYTTADSSELRLTHTGSKAFQVAAQPLETEVAIFVNPNNTFQSFMGIGGAVTDASAEVFATLPAEKQEAFLKSYFDKAEGIGYSLIRTTIHSCDFSSGSYTYVSDEDKALGTFSIDHDKQHRIPLIKRIISTAGGKIPLYVSPWSPPAFMKDNKNMLRGGKLLPEFYPSWAQYYTKFIKAYEALDIPIWGLTVQNEPMATQTWESCIYTAEEERDFLKNHLGPTLEKEGLGDKKIIVWDHNRDLINHRADVILSDPEASKYVWGIGFHWYETWTGGDPMFNNLDQINDAYPDKNLIFTEGCNEKFDTAKYQFWPNAERYGKSMINDFNQGTVAWTDWNILLDETGGPNHVSNLCFAPVHADTRTGELIYTPSYYYIGHFSKFIRPNAKRVGTAASRSALLSTSFLNQDGTMATVVMNMTDKPVTYKLYVGGQAIEEVIMAHGIQTVVY
jgi:glucosylceramidase